jgi:hypothetical protein
MVVFNPEIPEPQPPSYLNLSKPVERFELSSVGGTIARGLGSIVESATSAADTVVKSMIDDAVSKGVDTQRDALTGALEARTGVPYDERVGRPPDSESLTLSPQETPAALEGGIQYAGKINQAKLQNLDADLYYRGRLIDLSRDLRNQWGEGYRPYIDQRVAEMTGGNPANIYIQRLMATHNEMNKGQSDTMEKDLALIRQHADDTPGADDIYKRRLNGKATSEDVVAWLSRNKKDQIMINEKLNDRKFKEANRADKITLANDTYDSSLVETFEASWKNVMGATGYSPERASEIADRILAGETIPGLDEITLQRIGQSILATKANVEQRMRMNARRQVDGTTVESLLGAKTVEEKIKYHTQVYQDIAEKFLSNKAGAAFDTANVTEAIIRNRESKLFQDQSILGRYVTYGSIISKRGGMGADTLMKFLQPNTRLPGEAKLTDRIDAYLKGNHLNEFLLQPGYPAKPKTIKEISDDMILRRSEGTITDTEAASGTKVALTLPQSILNPNLQDWQKVNVIRGSFGAKNLGVLSNVKDDYVDPKGNPVIGQHTFFEQNTSKPMVDEVWRLSQGNRDLWDSTKIWVEKSQADLVSQDVRDLNTFAANPNIKLKFDTDSHRLVVLPPPARTQTMMDDRGPGFERGYQETQRIVNKINSTFQGLINIAEKEGRNPNAYILEQMIGMGLDPQMASVGKILSAFRASVPPVVDPFKTKDKTKNQDRVQ